MSGWREPARGSLGNPTVPLPAWPDTRQEIPEHGTDRRYKHRRKPCRCVPCREAHNAAQRARRAAR